GRLPLASDRRLRRRPFADTSRRKRLISPILPALPRPLPSAFRSSLPRQDEVLRQIDGRTRAGTLTDDPPDHRLELSPLLAVPRPHGFAVAVSPFAARHRLVAVAAAGHDLRSVRRLPTHAGPRLPRVRAASALGPGLLELPG